jgi:cytochrome c oxidase cbb3-type subunit I/II
MPPYPWLLEYTVDFQEVIGKIAAMKTLGVPYPAWTDEEIIQNMETQAQVIVDDLAKNFVSSQPDKQIIALIAYLQKLGTSEDVASAQARIKNANLKN